MVRLCAILLILTFAGCSDPDPDLSGKWKFQTVGTYDGYIKGTLTIVDGDNEPSCTMIVYQSEFGSAKLDCTLLWDGEVLTIQTEVISSSVPSWRTGTYTLRQTEKGLEGDVKKVTNYPVSFVRRN